MDFVAQLSGQVEEGDGLLGERWCQGRRGGNGERLIITRTRVGERPLVSEILARREHVATEACPHEWSGVHVAVPTSS